MSPRGRFLLATLAGLVLAGLVHGVVVLLIPRLSETDALSRARSSEALDHPMPVNTVSAGDAAGQTPGQAPVRPPARPRVEPRPGSRFPTPRWRWGSAPTTSPTGRCGSRPALGR